MTRLIARKPYAMDESCSRGRQYPESFTDMDREVYERDIDRVIHSRAFKRLAGKTQVITGRLSDHHRTRLTHSIEVATLSRSVARALGLNEDLACCLGFCHDLGHPPLDHAGEEILNAICTEFGDTFEHNRHTLTIVDEFEQKYISCPGLNLSFEVREGIVKHSASHTSSTDVSMAGFQMNLHPPLESQLIDFCDEICYLYSDLDDAREAGIVDVAGHILPELPFFADCYRTLQSNASSSEVKLLFNEMIRRLMRQTVQDFIHETERRTQDAGVHTVEEIRHTSGRLAGFSDMTTRNLSDLKHFLHRHYYHNPIVLDSRQCNAEKVRHLFALYLDKPTLLPHRYQEMIRSHRIPEYKVVVYYIAGFTDAYLEQMIRQFEL